MVDVDNIVDKATDLTKHLTANQQSERLRIDTTSPFKLPHLIRPISFIWAMANETILTTATIFAVFQLHDADSTVVNTLLASLAANTTILTTIIGFYFNSRKQEKINLIKARNEERISFDKSEAAIKIEAIRTKADIRSERKAARKAK